MKPPKPEELHTIISEARFGRAITILSRLDPTVAADAVMSLPYEEQQALFRRLPAALAAKLTATFPYYHAYVLLHTLTHNEMIAVLQKMNPIERTNFIDELPEETWQQITKEIDAQLSVEPAKEAIPVAVPPIIEAHQIEKRFERPGGGSIQVICPSKPVGGIGCDHCPARPFRFGKVNAAANTHRTDTSHFRKSPVAWCLPEWLQSRCCDRIPEFRVVSVADSAR
jgi:hypothetical protein